MWQKYRNSKDILTHMYIGSHFNFVEVSITYNIYESVGWKCLSN